MSRSLAALVALILLPSAPLASQPTTTEEPEDPEALAGLVGTWIAQDENLNTILGVNLSIENGALAGELITGMVGMGGPPFAEARLEGDRITLVTEPEEEGEAPARIVLQRTRRGLRLVRASLPYQTVRGHPTLLLRDELWRVMLMELNDMAHDDGDHEAGPVIAGTDAVRDAVRAAGREVILDDLDQCICLISLVHAPSPLPRIRARARALLQAAGRGSVCDVDVATMTPGEAGPTASGCARATIADGDGQTTLRARPSSRSAAQGTAANGDTFRVDDARGRWLYLGERRAWVHASNVRCQP